MSLSQFHCTSRLYLDMHGLIFETSICYWQDQPGRPPVPPADPARAGRSGGVKLVDGPRVGLVPLDGRWHGQGQGLFLVAGSRACYRG